MNQNPFGATAANPWDTGPSVEQAKDSILKEVSDHVLQAKALASGVKQARKEGNNLFLLWAAEQARLILRSIGTFIKRAIELAIFKFVLELCAMVIKTLMEALTKKGYSTMDVSTKGVVYHGDNPAPQAGKPGSFASNPFESTSYGRPW